MDATEVCRAVQQEVFGKGRLELLDELVCEDVVSHTTPPGAPAGRDGVRFTVQMLHAALDDIAYEERDAFASGDRVAIRCTMTGTQTGELFGRPATGRSFATDHIHIFRLRDGRVAEHWAVRDDLGMARQLGWF